MQQHITDKVIFDESVESLEDRITSWLAKIERKHAVSGLDRIRNLAYESVLYGCYQVDQAVNEANEEEIEAIYRNLYLYLQCSSNLFTLSKSGMSSEDLSVDDMEIDFVTDGFQGYVGINKWRDLYAAALIARERNVFKLLKGVTNDDLRADGGVADDYYYTYLDFLRALGSNGAGELLRQAQGQVQATRIISAEYRECLVEPVLNLWQAALEADAKRFNDLLEAGVSKHHQYWSQQKDDDGGDSYRCNYPAGFVAMNLTAIAAYAFDQGLPVSYHSDYLPRFFIEGYLKIDAKVTMPEG